MTARTPTCRATSSPAWCPSCCWSGTSSTARGWRGASGRSAARAWPRSRSTSGWPRRRSTPGGCSRRWASRADDVVTIFKGLQLDIGAPPQFMDFRYTVHDPWHGEFRLDHCGALMDVEPMGEDYVVSMCHDIEDPTFDATAVATNPRAQVRPVHRPPRTPADRHAALRLDRRHRRRPPAGRRSPRAAPSCAGSVAATVELDPIDPAEPGGGRLRGTAALRRGLRRLLPLRAGADRRRGLPADAPARPRLPLRTLPAPAARRRRRDRPQAAGRDRRPRGRTDPRGARPAARRRRQRAAAGAAPRAQPRRRTSRPVARRTAAGSPWPTTRPSSPRSPTSTRPPRPTRWR